MAQRVTKQKLPRRITIAGVSLAVQQADGGLRVVQRESGKVTRVKRVPSMEAAKLLLSAWEAELLNGGVAALNITDADKRAVMDFHRRVADWPAPPSIREALTFFLTERAALQGGWSVAECIAGRLHEIDRANGSVRYYNDSRRRLAIFAADFGHRPVRTIRREEISRWLHGRQAAPRTFASYQRLLHGLFEHAIRCGKLESNPASGIVKPKAAPSTPGILSPAQMRCLLHHCADEIRAAVCIQAFGGLRRAETERLDWSDVKLSRGFIDLSASKSKTAARRLIQMPDNLIAWLLPLARPAGTVCPSPQIYRDRLDAAREAAGITQWPANALRHSAISYRCAIEPDLAKVAQWGGNSPAVILANYKAVVEPDAGREWFSIEPEAKGKILKMA